MAYSIVQSKPFSSAGSSATLCVYASNVTAGNLLLCAYNVGDGSPVTGITDSQGNTWTRINTEFHDTSNGQLYGWFYAANAKAGATTLTIGHTGTLAAQSYVIAEISGVTATTPLRQSDEPAGSSTTATGTNALAGTSLTTTSGDFMAAMLDISNAATNTAGTGYTLIQNSPGVAGSTGSTAMEWKTATGTDQAKFTTTDSGNPYMVLTALFKPSGGAAKAITPAAVSASSAVTAGLVATRAVTPAAVSASSAMSAAVVAVRAVKPASVSATSAVSASVAKTALIHPAAVNATSAVTATAGAFRHLAPAVSATSSVSATVTKRAAVAATVNATSTVSAAVTRLAAVKPAAVNASSAVTVSFGTGLRGITPAAISATSTVTAAVHPLRRIQGASVSATSAVTARVAVLRSIRPSVSATSTVTAGLVAVRGVQLSVSATSTVTAAVAARRGLSAAITATSTVVASITGPVVPVFGRFDAPAPAENSYGGGLNANVYAAPGPGVELT